MCDRRSHKSRNGRFIPLVVALGVSAACITLQAQEITVTNSGVSWSGNTIMLSAPFGVDSEEQFIFVRNQTSSTITVIVHPHFDLNFIWFEYERGQEGNSARFTVPASQRFRLPFHSYMPNGTTKQYHDVLGFDILFADRRPSTYYEIPVSAYLHHAGSAAAERPSGYEVWETANDQLRRVDASQLPLKVYSDHGHYGAPAEFDDVFQRALNVWNVAGQSIDNGKACPNPTVVSTYATVGCLAVVS